MEEPTREFYGWHTQCGFADEPSGWMFEGGEEAYFEALEEWENFHKTNKNRKNVRKTEI